MPFLSCKSDIPGCMDPSSDDFNPEATMDDGSCSYHGNLVAWYDTNTRDSLLANGVASVGIYVDNEIFQNIIPSFIIWSSQPDCSNQGIGNWITMQNEKSKYINITVKALDGANVEIRSWNQTVTINASECELYQLIW